MATEKFEITGLDQIVDRLSKLPGKLQKRALQTAVRRGANIIRDAAQAGAERFDDPFTQEAIHLNVAVQHAPKMSRANGGIAMRVGVRGGASRYGDTLVNRRKQRVGQTYQTGGDKSNPGGDTWYWRFLEFGTSKMQAKPFLRPAFERNKDRALTVIADTLNREIDRLLQTNASE